MTPEEAREQLEKQFGNEDWTHYAIGPDPVDGQVKPWRFNARNDLDARQIGNHPPFSGRAIYRRTDATAI
ncbi:MAG: hypothetical protein AMXMBFR47_36520 [Planctomycetota bacterium]